MKEKDVIQCVCNEMKLQQSVIKTVKDAND